MTRILIVDDNPTNLYMLESALKGSGYQVTQARNGREALDLARNEPPGLVISDILMPVMDGYEFCRNWKADARLKKIPFVFYTATYTDPKDEAFGLSLGADRFLKKPAKIEDLQRVVKEVLAEAAAGAPAASAKAASESEVLSAHRDALFRKLEHKVEELEAEVAARRKAEAALQDAAKDLADKNRQLQDFIYISSYDLNDPLVNIRGYAEEIRSCCAEIAETAKQHPETALRLAPLIEEKLPASLHSIKAAVEDMDRLLAGLLRIAHLWNMPFATERVDMDALMAEMSESMYFRVQESGAELRRGKLPACSADRAQVKKVFAVLFDNALKYRAPGRKLVMEVSGRDEGDGFVSYTVADNGRGLTPEEESGKVWELFYRGAGKNLVAGEGVGLNIAKRVVEKHGGTVKAHALKEGGSEFTVRLPAAPKAGEKRGG